MLSRLLIRLVAALCAASCLAVPSQAMIFTEVEPVDLAGTGMRLSRMILGSGPIQPGDPQRFGSFMADRPRTHHFAGVQWGFALNSPGGNLMEGLRLGGAFCAHVVPTVVLDGQTCESACAVSTLGGAAMYATTLAAERVLQPGGAHRVSRHRGFTRYGGRGQ